MRRCSETVRALGAAAAVATLAGCGSCQSGPPSELEVDGPTPYVRCLAADPPEASEIAVGSVTIVREDRELTLTGLPDPARVVAFAGPGPAAGSAGEALGGLGELEPDLVLVLGDIGDTEPQAKATLAALGALGVPVLVVAGGRDDAVVWEEAFDSLEEPARGRVVDVTPYRRVSLGPHELVPVAGAPGGRYARTDAACGHGPQDLEEVAGALGEAPEGQRVLLSWAAPAGWAEGLGGAEAGDPQLAELAESVGASAGLFAFPAAVPPGAGDGPVRLGLRPVAGPPVADPAGGRVGSGPTLLALGPEGLKISD